MDGTYPERAICEAWLKKIDLALQKKREVFGQYAEECAKFYDGPPDYMWQEEKAASKERGWLAQGAALPNFRIQLNKAFEAVSRFGPTLFHQYPHVLVNPVPRPDVTPEALGIDPNDPYGLQQLQMLQAQKDLEFSVRRAHASIGHSYLNTVQRITNKKREARDGITDGIVRGLGLLHTELYTPRGSHVRFPRSERINECDYVKDADATRHEDVQWIAVRCVAPKNIVAERYGLHEDDLKGHFQSHAAQSTKRGQYEAKNGKKGENKSFDLVEYWKIYSKNGFGDKLTDFSDGKGTVGDYSVFGPYCYVVVARGIPFPLNLPPSAHAEDAEQLFERVAWPIPFWIPPLCDWPVSELGFYWKGGSIWPVSPMKPLIGPIRFVNWCLSFLADKCASAGTDYVAASKAAAEAIKSQLETGVGPYKLLELPADIVEHVGGVDKLVSVLQSPNFQPALWQMVAQMMDVIDRLSGLNELLAGMTATQMRSAEEASVKQANTQIIPDDMAQRVEDWLTLAAKKEMLAAHWLLNREDMVPVIGEEAAYIWETQMATQDIETIISDFEYTIEAGSARKPNIANKRQAVMEYGQAWGAVLAEMAGAGNVGPWNAYHRMLGEITQTDMSEFMLQPPDPNVPPPPTPEELEMQKNEQELAMDRERLQMDLFGKQTELEMKAAEHTQDLLFERAKFGMEMRHDAEKNKQDLQIQKQKGQAQVQAAKAKARATPSKNGSRT